MLAEVYSDKFLDEGTIREPIKFKAGLNTILGASRASNSIGKTTFLLIIDFCFGGKDYVKLNTDIDDNVGVHTIYFSFRFGEDYFYFSRSTKSINEVNKCDNEYRYVSTVDLKEF